MVSEDRKPLSTGDPGTSRHGRACVSVANCVGALPLGILTLCISFQILEFEGGSCWTLISQPSFLPLYTCSQYGWVTNTWRTGLLFLSGESLPCITSESHFFLHICWWRWVCIAVSIWFENWSGAAFQTCVHHGTLCKNPRKLFTHWSSSFSFPKRPKCLFLTWMQACFYSS